MIGEWGGKKTGVGRQMTHLGRAKARQMIGVLRQMMGEKEASDRDGEAYK